MKVVAPGFALDASGKLGGAIVASKWKGRQYFRGLVRPSNPKSGGQTGVRAMFKFLAQQWAGLTAPQKATWDTIGEQIVASPFNGYMKVNQTRWRNFLAPGKNEPVPGTGTQATFTGLVATGGVRQITIASNGAGTIADGWGIALFRSVTETFDSAFANCIAVVAMNATAEFSYVDTPLEPGQYFYTGRLFTIDGNLGAEEADVNALVT